MLKVRESKKLVPERVENILVRGTNWIGDVIMTLPAIRSVRKTFPHAKISVLAKPWVAEIYRICPEVDEVIVYNRPGVHSGITGIYKLARELKSKGFDMAILFQNAIEAAIIARLAGIPIRAGYNSDGRGLLLTHSVKRTKQIRKVHQVYYYLEMLKSLGFQSTESDIRLKLNNDFLKIAEDILGQYYVKKNDFLVGVAPGAAYGPAKMWFPERFAAVADKLADNFSARVVLFGSGGDSKRADLVQKHSKNNLINIAGKTSLREVIALIARCNLFISNDSGLMHLAGALGIPLVAIFGSTNPVTTSPVGGKNIIIYKNVSCSPCLKKICPADFRCMDLISVDDVYEAARDVSGGT
ncbi:MAG: lipopolysaccharide heptosyltransferase II [Desulfobacteraceae bacterium 4484_190.3]|nr:MAG: lipopolysaccharide heptosyltransferase II [Desulfobacteraceae bacterium 4484_190.3]